MKIADDADRRPTTARPAASVRGAAVARAYYYDDGAS
jgi:hypothetical protein